MALVAALLVACVLWKRSHRIPQNTSHYPVELTMMQLETMHPFFLTSRMQVEMIDSAAVAIAIVPRALSTHEGSNAQEAPSARAKSPILCRIVSNFPVTNIFFWSYSSSAAASNSLPEIFCCLKILIPFTIEGAARRAWCC
jgi:hypothetical protein